MEPGERNIELRISKIMPHSAVRNASKDVGIGASMK